MKLDDPNNNTAPPEVIEVVKKAIQGQITKTGQHFVGVMGFSEGARLAAGIALHQQQQRQLQRDSDDEENGFLFAILLNATNPPLTLTPPPSLLSSLISGTPKVTLPSIISIGATDPWKPSTKSLIADSFDPKNLKVFEFNNGHHLPTERVDTLRLANAIINLYHRIIDNY